MATTKVFKSGNAMAVRLPAAFNAVAGTVVEVRDVQGKWVVEPVTAAPRKFNVDKVWGSAKGSGLAMNPDRSFADRPSSLAGSDGQATHLPD